MQKSFHVALESLTTMAQGAGGAALLETERSRDPSVNSSLLHSGVAGTFFLETFGCQMNDHDSEKVAGVLASRGYRQVQKPADASVILYNTCSIREKAAQKVFSRLGEFRGGADADKIIGVLGCVAGRRRDFQARSLGQPGVWFRQLSQAS
jgi:hypothetical protein